MQRLACNMRGISINKPRKQLLGTEKTALHVSGELEAVLAHRKKCTKQNVYVVRNLKTNLLGLPAMMALEMVARLDTVTRTDEIFNQYSSLFAGLGNLGEPYDIQLQPGAKPHALFVSRNIPLPQRPQVQKELQRMETLKVISKVDAPTPWCAGMVAIPKKDGSVRICVDLKPLNAYVLREIHFLPKVDEILAQLNEAKCFSKLDANAG